MNSKDLRSSSASINHPNVLSSPIGTATGSRRRSIMRGSPCSPCPQPIAEVVGATRLLLRRRTAHESLAPFKLQSRAQSSTPISRLSFLFQHRGPRATPAPDAGRPMRILKGPARCAPNLLPEAPRSPADGLGGLFCCPYTFRRSETVKCPSRQTIDDPLLLGRRCAAALLATRN